MTSTTNRAHTNYGAQVLILLGAYLFGGGGDDPMSLTERVQEIVQDDTRRLSAGDYARQIEAILVQTSDDSLQLRKRIIAEMNEDSRDMDQLSADLEQALDATLASEQQVVELRFKMKESMTRGEWARLFSELRAGQ